jgi:hypothetical protein
MTKKEIIKNGYSINQWEVTKNDKAIAYLKSIEWELYKNNIVREISVTTKNHMKDQEMIDMIKFLHTRYPKFKIEINNDNSDEFFNQ